jgi:prepilin-type N-terminal cleavage/methylation domain-containing protein
MSASSSQRNAGFTVIELIVVIVILAAAGILFFYQKNALQTANQDEQKKTIANSIYYGLEEVYYEKNKSYPAELTANDLPTVDPTLLESTGIVKMNDSDNETQTEPTVTSYSYEPTNCDMDGKCKGYTLRVQLINEAEFVKKSKRN